MPRSFRINESDVVIKAADMICEIGEKEFSHPNECSRIHAAYMAVMAELFKRMVEINERDKKAPC